MYCQKCGAQNTDTAKFCTECGAPFNRIPNTTIPPEQNAAATPVQNTQYFQQVPFQQIPVQPKKKNRGCLIAFIAAVGFIVLCGVLAATMAKQQQGMESSKQQGTEASRAKETLSAEELKTKGQEFDKRAWDDFLALYKAHTNFMKSTDSYSNGKVTELDFYDYCKKVKDYFSNASLAFNYSKTDDERAYLSTFSTFAIEEQMAAEMLLKYVDSKAIKDLSGAKEHIATAKEAAITIAGNRAVFLKKIGLSEDEISKISDQIKDDIKKIDGK